MSHSLQQLVMCYTSLSHTHARTLCLFCACFCYDSFFPTELIQSWIHLQQQRQTEVSGWEVFTADGPGGLVCMVGPEGELVGNGVLASRHLGGAWSLSRRSENGCFANYPVKAHVCI